MQDDQDLVAELPRLSDFIANKLGLHFPHSRWNDLQRGFTAASRELGFASPAACARRMLAGSVTRQHIEILASHLTVGETYFLREPKSFELLGRKILPALIRQRRSGDRQLRIWSAACCTGEEAYSLAIVLHQIIPDIADWNITLLATDINLHFLQKATAGIYGQWSFRQVPHGFRERFFLPVSENRWEIRPEIKRLVRFAPLNLVEDPFPAMASQTNAMDVIFCRNALMYFTAEQVRKVIESLHRAQFDGGWLITGSGELSQLTSVPYFAENFQGTTYYRKFENAAQSQSPRSVERELPLVSVATKVEIIPRKETASLPKREECNSSSFSPLKKSSEFHQTAQMLANRGRLAEALDCCDQWVATDRLDPSGHYFRAVILQEYGAADEAMKSLRRALYLNPDSVSAHFAMGNIERNRGRGREAVKHMEIVRRLLCGYAPDHVLPELDGVTARRFTEIVNAILEMEQTA